MIGNIFSTTVSTPLYNALVLLLDILPSANLAFAIIILTAFVRLILFPLSKQAVLMQIKMREIDPELKKIKEKHKDNREAQALAMLELYRAHNIRPFSSILLVLIQIPIIIGLYFVILRGGFPAIDPSLLYSFVAVPESVSTAFFGIDVMEKSVVIALVAAIAQYFQAKYAMPKPPERKAGAQPSFKDDFARSMHIQMRFVFPIIIFGIAWSLSAAIALYFATSSLFTIGQELVLRKRRAEQKKTELKVS